MEAAHDIAATGGSLPGARARPAWTLVAALERRHPAARGHSRAVALLAGSIARALSVAPLAEVTVSIAGSLHDVGKLSLAPHVLEKPGPLTAAEWLLVRAHPVDGERLLRPLLGHLPEVLSAVRSHHERWDGGGYPDGLAGADAPQAARIVAVADAYTAMTEVRPYRPALSPARALAEVREHAGSQFDPDCVTALGTALRTRTAGRATGSGGRRARS